MHAQKIEQQATALATLIKQLARQTPVEEFHAPSDRARLAHLGESAQERFQVNLQDMFSAVLPVVDQTFLDIEKFADRNFLGSHHVAVDLQVSPLTHPGTQGEVEPVGLDDRFLDLVHHTLHWCACKTVVTRFTQACQGILHLATQQQGLAQIGQVVQHLVRRVAFFIHVVLQSFKKIPVESHTSSHASVNCR